MSVRSATTRVLAAVTILFLLPTSGAAREPQTSAFDLDNGNAAIEIVIPAATGPLLSTLNPGDASLILRITTLTNNAWFDAIAPYHPMAVGVSSRLGRRPAAERATNRQRNIAILYASFHMFMNLLPQFREEWRAMLRSAGLDPDDRNRDLASPVGIGTRAAEAVIASRIHDGMNQLGDEGGRRYHRQPYADYLGYRPVNTAEVLRDPSRWQPDLVTSGNGVFRAQKFVTPQYGVTRPYSFRSPSQFHVPAPRNSDAARNPSGYRRQAEEVLRASANLTDVQKLSAEHFNNKLQSLPTTVIHLAETRQYTLDEFIFHEFLTNLAAFDAGIVVWHFKRRYDAVRPFSAIHYLYGDRYVRAWGGPGRGTVNDIRGAEWRSYLDTADHPEYPSGSAAFCAAHAEASRRFTGTDALGQSVTVASGASVVEPDVTPRSDTTLGPWPTWTQWARDCGLSRVWGGVHFQDAVTEGAALGARVGEYAFRFLSGHIQGRPPAPVAG
ncbi:DUF6851 domain-containing protein [Polymorphospora sp. NPDC051019]|uniref:DUF6851 domain-containing protein n=1 Tax=Polymorphospora sp. NPDC051019 TaxID=3155725 RepID=UPI003448A8BC